MVIQYHISHWTLTCSQRFNVSTIFILLFSIFDYYFENSFCLKKKMSTYRSYKSMRPNWATQNHSNQRNENRENKNWIDLFLKPAGFISQIKKKLRIVGENSFFFSFPQDSANFFFFTQQIIFQFCIKLVVGWAIFQINEESNPRS